MWSDVRICSVEHGHIQAIGRDKKGRKQYVYHEKWSEKKQREKFAKLTDFGQQLPHLRQVCSEYLSQTRWTKEKVLSLAVMILDEFGIRIGNKQYTEKNQTYGLTTLRRKHLDLHEDDLVIEYTGKSNKEQIVRVDDEELIRLIRACAELPGYEIFRYKDEHGQYSAIDSQDVNEFIQKVLGDQFSSKDFRTWVANRLLVEYYPEATQIKKKYPRRKFEPIIVKLVAQELGHKPAICKKYYIHDSLLKAAVNHCLPVVKDFAHDKEPYGLSAEEKVILAVL